MSLSYRTCNIMLFHCFLAKTKTELFKFVKLIAEYCNRHGLRMEVLYTDAGKVETSAKFQADCARVNGVNNRGVKVHPAPQDNQQQNPV